MVPARLDAEDTTLHHTPISDGGYHWKDNCNNIYMQSKGSIVTWKIVYFQNTQLEN